MAADYTRAEVVTKTIEYRIEFPATHVDVAQTLLFAQREAENTLGGLYDNTVMVRAGDEEIIFAFEVTA